MTDRVLKRYELQTKQAHLEPLYPGAEVWLGRDTQVGLPATIITYPWALAQDSNLPSVQTWLANGQGKDCASQWRGKHAPIRAELWDHIAGLFGALSSIHESRIVHRRIQPHNILVDEALSRSQPGFLKLGRFEASTFFRNSAPPNPATSATQVDGHDPWYAVDLGAQPARGPMLGGTPAGDVYALSLTTFAYHQYAA